MKREDFDKAKSIITAINDTENAITQLKENRYIVVIKFDTGIVSNEYVLTRNMRVKIRELLLEDLQRLKQELEEI